MVPFFYVIVILMGVLPVAFFLFGMFGIGLKKVSLGVFVPLGLLSLPFITSLLLFWGGVLVLTSLFSWYMGSFFYEEKY